MLPYQTVLTVACVLLAMRYVLDVDASIRGRVIVVAITVASFLMPVSPSGQALSILGRLGVSLFGLFRLKILTSGR